MGKPWCKIYMFIVSGNIGIFTMLFILFACFVFNVYIYNIFRILCIYSACQWIELWIIQVFLGCYNFQSKCWSWIALRLVSTISPWKPNRSDPDGLTSGNCHLQVSLAKFKDLSLRIVILQLVGYLTSWVGQPNGSSNIIWVCPNSGVPPGYLIASNGWCPTVFPHSICAILVPLHWTDDPQAWELETMFLVRLYKNPKPDNEGTHPAVHKT